jgi:hypothetical protein
MKRIQMTACLLIATFSLVASTRAALSLRNGNFDLDPDLGGADDSVTAPTHWFVRYTIDQSWSDFRFGNNGNGGWTNNGIALGQNYLGPTFEPGPEDGYFYTSLGAYTGELSARIDGFGYNRINGNAAGNFEVGFYYSPGSTFTGANGSDVAGSAVLLGTLLVDISALTGTTPRSAPFTLPVTFAGSGIYPGDEVWLRFGDGPDDGNLNTFDEPIIDNLTLTTVIPEPSSLALLLTAGIGAAAVAKWRRRRGARPGS